MHANEHWNVCFTSLASFDKKEEKEMKISRDLNYKFAYESYF